MGRIVLQSQRRVAVIDHKKSLQLPQGVTDNRRKGKYGCALKITTIIIEFILLYLTHTI